MRHVIGFGNPLHGDDGVAAVICAALRDQALASDVRVFDAGTRGLDALALLAGCQEAILIDAAWPVDRPGRITFPDPAEILAETGLSCHVGGVGVLLRALTAIDPQPPQIRLLTIEAERLNRFEPGLSPAVAEAARRVVADLLRALGAS